MASFHIRLLTLVSLVFSCSAAVHINKPLDHNALERESDGSYKSRDSEHYDEGNHNADFDHEAILGSVKDAEEFDKLSPQESKERLAELLPQMDINHNMVIERNELQRWILINFKKLSREEAEERLLESDDNRDGSVSWNEYLKDAFGVDDEEEVGEEDTGDIGMHVHEEKAMWVSADTNGDGVLDIDEFEVFTNPEEHEAMHPHLLNQTMREKDKNKDGYIDFEEYLGDREDVQDREWRISEEVKFTHSLDLDEDGRLNLEEVQQWVIPNNKHIAAEEVDHLFSSADDNRDNLLSFNEVINHYDVFVGSDITRYDDLLGTHLQDEL